MEAKKIQNRTQTLPGSTGIIYEVIVVSQQIP